MSGVHKQGGGGSSSASASKEDEPIKVILLADSFSKTFRPVSLEMPKVLFPLVNVPMLDYSLEFLAQNKVGQVFVFCAWHYQQIEQYINQSKWLSVLNIRIISTPNCEASADAIRELDSLGIITNNDPFVIISGDVVTNIDLKKAVEFHKERARLDTDCVMTVVFKQLHKEAPIRRSDDDLRVGLDLCNSQIVLFDNDTFLPDKKTGKKVDRDNIKIPFHILKDHPKLCIRSDLLDCHIDICSPLLMVEINSQSMFDYKDIRKDYIRNEVSGNPGFAKNMYGYIVQSGEYAARVHDPRTYHTISRDIINLWLSPFNPDSHIMGKKSSYTHVGKYVYREKDVTVDRTAILEESVVVGSHTIIGEKEGILATAAIKPAVIRRSVIGRNCKIANGVRISDSHIWDNVIVEEDCVIDHAIICSGAVIKRGATVPRGAIISFGVVVNANILPNFSRVSKFQRSKDERNSSSGGGGGDGGGDNSSDSNSDSSSSDDDEEDSSLPNNDDDIIGDIDYESMSSKDIKLRQGFETDVRIWKTVNGESRGSIGGLNKSELLMKRSNWKTVKPLIPSAKREIKVGSINDYLEKIYSSRDNKDIVRTMIMEIKSFRLSFVKSNNDCLEVIVPFIMSKVREQSQAMAGNPKVNFILMFPDAVKPGAWGYELLASNIFFVPNGVTILTSLDSFVLKPENEFLRNIYGSVLSTLYDKINLGDGLIADNFNKAVLEWASSRRDLVEKNPTDPTAVLFNSDKVKSFVNRLKQDAEGSDDDDKSSSSSSNSSSSNSSDSSSSSSSSSDSDSSSDSSSSSSDSNSDSEKDDKEINDDNSD